MVTLASIYKPENFPAEASPFYDANARIMRHGKLATKEQTLSLGEVPVKPGCAERLRFTCRLDGVLRGCLWVKAITLRVENPANLEDIQITEAAIAGLPLIGVSLEYLPGSREVKISFFPTLLLEGQTVQVVIAGVNSAQSFTVSAEAEAELMETAVVVEVLPQPLQEFLRGVILDVAKVLAVS